MLQAEIFDLKYCRTLLDEASPELGKALASEFGYVFAVCYGKCDFEAYETIEKTAAVLDLQLGAEKLLANFHATTRNQVRKTEKMEGLEFHVGFGKEFDRLYAFYSNCEHARSWFPVPESELAGSLFFYATFDGVPFTGISAYTHAGRIRVSRIFSLKKAPTDPRWNNLLFGASAKRIVMNMCRYGIEHGCHTLDLAGVDFRDPAKSGISEFKLSFGITLQPVLIARYTSPAFQQQLPRIRAAGYDIT